MLISMALRFIPMLLEEYDRLRMAQMARGADFAVGSIVQRSRAVAALAVPLSSPPSGAPTNWPWRWRPGDTGAAPERRFGN